MGRAARKLNLSGVFAAAVTPNRPGTLEIDYSAFLDQLDFLAGAGVDAICVMDSTGEFPHYKIEDRTRAIYLASKRTRVPLIAGVGHSTFTGAAQLAHEAISSGADALLIMPPHFFRYDQRTVEEFCRALAIEVGDAVPLLLDNEPQFTSPIEFETARTLLESGLYAGIKDSPEDALLHLRRDRPFAFFAGNDNSAASALRQGADGVISASAAAIPELLVAIRRAMGKDDALNARLAEFASRAAQFPAPAAVKQAVALRGQKAGDFAVPPQTAELEAFSDWFRTWWP